MLAGIISETVIQLGKARLSETFEILNLFRRTLKGELCPSLLSYSGFTEVFTSKPLQGIKPTMRLFIYPKLIESFDLQFFIVLDLRIKKKADKKRCTSRFVNFFWVKYHFKRFTFSYC